MDHAIVERELVGSIWSESNQSGRFCRTKDAAAYAKASPWLPPAAIMNDVYWEVDHATAAGSTGRHFFSQ
jgi:hypothetical protein